MNTTGRWLARIGALVIVLGFFLPALAVSCTVSPMGVSGSGFGDLIDQSIGEELGMGGLGGGVSGQLFSVSLNDIAGLLPSAGWLYLVPVGALAVVILTLLVVASQTGEQSMLIGQISGVALGA